MCIATYRDGGMKNLQQQKKQHNKKGEKIMKFEYEGRTFDTDNRIYVLGYKITTNWFPVKLTESRTTSQLDDYGPKVVSAFVRELLFDLKEVDGREKNVVVGIRFNFSKAAGYSFNTVFGNGHIIGRSPKECLKIYREKTKKTGEKQNNV